MQLLLKEQEMPQIIRNNVNEENRKQIESFLAQLELDKGLDLIKTIFDFISKLVSESILYNQKRLADLFCRTIQSIEIGEFSPDIQSCVINAFKNINKVVINNPEEGNTCILYLLSILYNTREEPDSEQITKLIDSGFINLISDLDKISIIFAMKDDHQTKLFPIENFLCKILEINNFIRDLNKPETIQALMFALQVFDKKNYPTEIQDILKIVKDYNLEFINYLYHGAYHCYENWKEDFEKNGSLILYDEIKHKVLIRNPKESYFTQNEMCNNYCLSEIRRELNSSKDVIAYFIEYELEISDYVELEDELVKKGNKSRIIDILSLIYDYGYYNILGLRKLIFEDKKLLPINPFSYNDAYCFINAKPERYSLSHISNFLKDKYGLVRVIGKGINYVNIGTLVLLQSISNVGIKRLDFNNKIKTVSDLLCEWLELCSG